MTQAFSRYVALLFALSSFTNAATISLLPSFQRIPLGSTAEVDAVVSGLPVGTPLGGFDFTVAFDPAILSLLSVDFGPGLGNVSTTALATLDPSVPGLIRLIEVSLLVPSDLVPLQGSEFSIATLGFQGISPGISPLAVDDLTLSDANSPASAIPAGTVGAAIEVVPEPKFSYLLGAGLLTLVISWKRGRSAGMLLAVLYLPLSSFAQTDFARFPGTALQYSVKTEIDTRGGANLYLKAFVTVKNTGNANQSVMLCVTGYSQKQAAPRTSPVQSVEVFYDANSKQFQCRAAAAAVMNSRRFGNMGCEMKAIAKNGEETFTFVSGSSPDTMADLKAQIESGSVVQDGNVRKINGAGFVPGHRMASRAGNFGLKSKPLYDILAYYRLTALQMAAGQEMGCLKPADVTAANGEPAYNPPCTKPVLKNLACNKCFAMNTRMEFPADADLPMGVIRSVVFPNIQESVPKGKTKTAIPLITDTDFAGGVPTPTQAIATVQFIPGAGIAPTLLNNCDPALPGCYGLSTTTPLITPGAAEDWGILTINYPDVLPSNFTGDFFIKLSTAVPDGHGGFTAGAALNETWVKVRTPLVCDVNQDGITDSDDISLIIGAIGSSVDPGSLYDFDGDGQITVLDARGCVGRCTNSYCAK